MTRRAYHNAACMGLLKNVRAEWRAMRQHQRHRAQQPMATPRGDA